MGSQINSKNFSTSITCIYCTACNKFTISLLSLWLQWKLAFSCLYIPNGNSWQRCRRDGKILYVLCTNSGMFLLLFRQQLLYVDAVVSSYTWPLVQGKHINKSIPYTHGSWSLHMVHTTYGWGKSPTCWFDFCFLEFNPTGGTLY